MGSPLMNQFDIDEDHLPSNQKISKYKNRQFSMNPGALNIDKIKDSLKKPGSDDKWSDNVVSSPMPKNAKQLSQLSPLRRNTILPKGFRSQSTVERLFNQQT